MSDTAQQHIEGNTDSGLPEGWTLAKLGDLCTHPQYGWTTSADKNGTGLRLLRTTDISSGTVNWSTVPACAQDPDDPQKYLLAPGDILVSRAGSVGLSHLVKECPKAIFASYLIRFRPKPPLESDFIALFLRSPQYWVAIADQTSGIAIPNVNASKLKQLEVLLPPLPEQKRIVTKVEELLTRVNATKDRLSKVSTILKRFRQSVLAAACSGRLTADWRDRHQDVEPASIYLERILLKRRKRWGTARTEKRKQTYVEPLAPEVRNGAELPETWCWASIGQCFFADSGEAFKKRDYSNNGLRLFQIANVGFGKTVWEQRNYLPESFMKSYPELILEVGDICMALNRPILGDNLKVTRISADDLPAILYQRVACLRAVEQPVGDFAFLYMLSDRFRELVQDNLQGTDQPYLNISLLPKFPLPHPPILEQQEIVRRVESMFKLTDAVEKRVAAATVRSEKLTQAILAKASRGELVPTEAELARREDRSYEPASVLLTRIKAVHGADKNPERVRSRGVRGHRRCNIGQVI